WVASVPGRASPNLFQSLIPPASFPVSAIVRRVGFAEVLVILLCWVKLTRARDLDNNGTLEVLFECLFRGFGRLFLVFVEIEDGRTIRRTAVAKLAVGGKGIDVVPKDVEELRVTDPSRIVGNFDRLGVAGGTG